MSMNKFIGFMKILKKILTLILVSCVAVFGFALSAPRRDYLKREPSISFFGGNFLYLFLEKYYTPFLFESVVAT